MNSVLRTRVNAWATFVNARTVRERALMFLTLMAVVYAFAVAVIFAPLQREQNGLRQTVLDRSAEIEALNTKLQQDLARQGSDKLAQTARLDELQKQLHALETSSPKQKRQMVPPKEMVRLVTQLLQANPKLRWIEMESLKPAPMEGDHGVAGAERSVIYKHGLRMRFSGEYRDIVDYLRTLEALPWAIFWGEIALEVDAPPRSTVSVVIYTLSAHETWIGG